MTEGKLRHEFTLENFFAQRAFVINEAAGTEITIELEGEDEGRLSVSDSISRILAGEIKDSAEPWSVRSFYRQTISTLTVWRLVEGPGNFVIDQQPPIDSPSRPGRRHPNTSRRIGTRKHRLPRGH